MRTLFRPLLLGAVCLLAPLHAEVVDKSEAGFTIRRVLIIPAPPAEVYRKFVANVGDWWASSHTFSKDAHNLSIDARPGGCFCEKLADGGGVQHLQVTFVAPGKSIILRGGLGPLMALGATGGLALTFAPSEAGTSLTVVYSVGGYFPKGGDAWAAPVDGMLAETFTRFSQFVTTGSPDPKAKP